MTGYFGFSPRRLAVAAVLATAAVAGGCGQASLTPLPELTKLPAELIDLKQKQAAMKELAEVGTKHETEAIDAIEKAR